MEITITGAIEPDFTAKEVRGQLKEANGEPLDIYINSPGGSVYDAFEIYNDIQKYKKDTGKQVKTFANGFVASAAAYLFMVGDKRVAFDNSVLMIHNTSMVAIGDYREMAFWADDLKRTDLVSAKTYARASGKELNEILDLMSAGENNNGTYFYGDEIFQEGFANELIQAEEESDKAACINKSKVAFADFIKNSKPTFYDKLKVASLIGPPPDDKKTPFGDDSQEEKNNRGETMSKKAEVLQTLLTLKTNAEITLPEVAKHLGLEDQLITKEQKENLATLDKINKRCGDKSPIEYLDEIEAERKQNAADIREARMTNEFGPKIIAETKKANLAREQAELIVGDQEITDDLVKKVKENAIWKKFQSEIADPNSDMNTFGASHEKAAASGGRKKAEY